ncbi:immunity 52 family protein [Archangium violaceum]|uniref:Imm52 family immunity protein n=1 Tax=Archangium violaceum TaxID=83451 RepID=UPI0019518039|nr:Imm52 family immunity protein [Archangium violaceum]QRN94738.1 immunity 52 family protein [Archangium violaceum]
MKERYYVGAYWGPRQETALECARRAELFFLMLARCDPTFAQWYRAGRGAPRDLPGHPMPQEVKELEALFLQGRIRTSSSRKVIEELGFSQIMWNAKKAATDIHLSCGAYSPWGGPNVCLLYPTTEEPIRKRLLRAPVLAQVLTSMVTAWDPDFAMATSSEMVNLVEKRKWEVRMGWLTYLSRRRGTLPPLPEPVRIEPVGELGWLLILSPELMTASNPEHVAFTAHVRELLDRAGLIELPAPATP